MRQLIMGEGNSENSWKELAKNLQQEYLNSFGQFKWDSYEYSEREYLEKKVGYALFGLPPELPFTTVERIAKAIMNDDINTFLLYLSPKDFVSLQTKAFNFIKDKIKQSLSSSTNYLLGHIVTYEHEIIAAMCNCVLAGDKSGFLNYWEFSESDWDNLTKICQVFLEEQVGALLIGDEGKRIQYTTKQVEIIRRVSEMLLLPDKGKFLLYLTESTWTSCKDAARELLREKVGKNLFRWRLFKYTDTEKEQIESLCEMILGGNKDQFLKYHTLSEWYSYHADLVQLYEEKVGNALFGPPGKLMLKKENQTGYTAKQYEVIQKVCSAIIREDQHGQSSNEETYMSIIFVCLEMQQGGEPQILPVAIFRIPSNSEGSVHFIDGNARVYKTWDDFLENNELPQCEFCYPHGGVYQCDDEGSVLVDFGKTPACKITNKTTNLLDKANSGLMLGGMVVSAAALFVPVAAPLLAITAATTSASGVYSVARVSSSLIDRAQHNQSIGLEDPDARSCWLTIAGSTLGIASMGATSALTTMTQAGEVVSNAGRIATTALNFSSLAVNGLGIIHGAHTLHNKYLEGGLTPLDVFQFSASLLFFTHSAVNFKTADTIITETQADVLQQYQDNLRSNRHRKMFRKVAKNTQRDMDPIEGRAQVIRKLGRIENKDDFFAGLVRTDKNFRQTKSSVKLSDNGLVEINGQLRVDPAKFAQVSQEQRKIILNVTKKLAQGNISMQDFMTSTNPIFTQQNISLTPVEINNCAVSIRDMVCGNNIVDVRPQYQMIMQQAVLQEALPIAQILMQFDRKLHLRLLEVTARLINTLSLITPNEFVKVLQFVCNSVYRFASDMEQTYTEDLERARENAGSTFDQETFDRNYNINEKRMECFCFLILEQLVHPTVFESLKAAYIYGQSYFSNNRNNSNIIASSSDNNSDLSERAENVEFSGWNTVLKYTEEHPLLKIREFQVSGNIVVLTEEEILDVVREVIDISVDSTNCIIQYEVMDIYACVIVPFGPATYIKITSDIDGGLLTAYAYYDD